MQSIPGEPHERRGYDRLATPSARAVEIGVTTRPIRGLKKVHVGPLGVKMQMVWPIEAIRVWQAG